MIDYFICTLSANLRNKAKENAGKRGGDSHSLVGGPTHRHGRRFHFHVVVDFFFSCGLGEEQRNDDIGVRKQTPGGHFESGASLVRLASPPGVCVCATNTK